MQNINALFSHSVIKKIDKELAKIFQGTPHLPKKVINLIVQVGPYLLLISGLYLIVNGLSSIAGANYSYQMINFLRGISPIYFYLIGLLEILAGTISLITYKPLKNRELNGWFALLCLSLLETIMSVISVIVFRSGLFSSLLSLLISFYLLYEIKPEYSVVKTLLVKTKKVKAQIKSEVDKVTAKK